MTLAWLGVGDRFGSLPLDSPLWHLVWHGWDGWSGARGAPYRLFRGTNPIDHKSVFHMLLQLD